MWEERPPFCVLGVGSGEAGQVTLGRDWAWFPRLDLTVGSMGQKERVTCGVGRPREGRVDVAWGPVIPGN